MNQKASEHLDAVRERPRGRTLGYTALVAVIVVGAGLFAWSRRGGGVVDRAREAHAEAKARVHGTAAKPKAAEPSLAERLAALHVPRPKAIRGLYLNAWAAGSPRKLAKLIDIADRTEVNTFVVDVKEGGFISYRSQVPVAKELGLDSAYIRDIRGVLKKLKAHGIYPIARIVCFKDPVLAEKRPEWAIHRQDGALWADAKGKHWVDSYNRRVWDYNIAIAKEALELGFAEVQWDYVRFPDVTASVRKTMVYPAAQGRTREDAIREFLLYSRKELAPYGVPVTADVFGLTVTAIDDMGIGQRWEKLTTAADVLLPMVYPSHYFRGNYGLAYPNAVPYKTVYNAMSEALRRTKAAGGTAQIRPWLQDFTLGPPHYGPSEVRAQIQAVYDNGLDEWILWNPGSNYNVAALEPAPAAGGEGKLATAPAAAAPGAAAASARVVSDAAAPPGGGLRQAPLPEPGAPTSTGLDARLLGTPVPVSMPGRPDSVPTRR
ncbi:MAG TPA: putative glycoside hydrolase [Longimicrobiales bacterium]|nr:putative glycoside hydrolase [Longimicrobiales bacterium]